MELYGISAVSRETGIHESSLRRWEEMDLICPDRVDMGQTSVRIYTEDELDLLKQVKELIDSGIMVRTAFEWAVGEDE
jgi:MerR family transcriptional regulator, heat shock protein HspR